MVQKYRNKENERVVILEITEKGKISVEDFFNNDSHSFGDMVKQFSYISNKELETIRFFLKELEEIIDKKLQ